MEKIIAYIQSDVFLMWITVFVSAYLANYLLGVYLGGKYEGFSWRKFIDGLIKGFILAIAMGLLIFAGMIVNEIELSGLGKISILATIIIIFSAGAGKYVLEALKKLAFIMGVKLPEKYQLDYTPQVTEEMMIDGYGVSDGGYYG